MDVFGDEFVLYVEDVLSHDICVDDAGEAGRDPFEDCFPLFHSVTDLGQDRVEHEHHHRAGPDDENVEHDGPCPIYRADVLSERCLSSNDSSQRKNKSVGYVPAW